MMQLSLALLTSIAICMTQVRHEKANKWAPVVGMASQPFWFWEAYVANQHGILFTTAVISGVWAYGIYDKFLKGYCT